MMELDDIMEIDQTSNIAIEIGSKLFVNIDGVDFTVNSIFVGMRVNEYMIITPPARFSNVKSKMYPGNSILVKYLYDGTVYAFQSEIIELIFEPINIVAIQYPRLVQRQELRETKRSPCVIPARAEIRTWEVPVVVFDINKKGCRFKFQENREKTIRFNLKDAFTLHFKLPGISEELSARVRVKNIQRQSKQVEIGVVYEAVQSTFLKRLEQYLFSVDVF
ncbi:MAG: flagellar brake protein [Desulfobacteraceae bacterium]|nr:flagellar brake protein [Desulfobacteraceae bacterium]